VGTPRSARPARAEPLIWLLFTSGGGVSAFLFPVHVVILGIALAAGWLGEDALSYRRIADLVGNPLVKIYLVVLIALPLFHAAHRIRFGLRHELKIEKAKRTLAVLCYGTALLGTVLTVAVLAGI
jgi:fumarate reductase subunit D